MYNGRSQPDGPDLVEAPPFTVPMLLSDDAVSFLLDTSAHVRHNDLCDELVVLSSEEVYRG